MAQLPNKRVCVALCAVLGLALSIGALRATVAVGESANEVVSAKSGPIKGKIVDGVRSFPGIPYAAPPTGELRWKPPVAPAAWKEVRETTKFGCACPQISQTLMRGIGEQGEDCLSLNVWTAAKGRSDGLPVMVWIYGGGFYAGGTAQPEYDGAALAKKGVVLVTVNYRVSVLGFLAHPALSAESAQHASGNYGMLDLVFALKWVRENIREFGGNPGNVTIFGQSAGAAAVHALITSPLSKGLFQRAIAHSGSAGNRLRYRDRSVSGFDSMESVGLAFAKRLGVEGEDDTLKAMRAKTWQQVMEAARPSNSLPGGGLLDHLSVDGYFLQEPPGVTLAAGKQMNIPFMAGSTADEGTLFNRGRIDSLEKYRQHFATSFGKNSEEALRLYPATDAASAARAFNDSAGDNFVCGARRLVHLMSKQQPKTWLYHFTQVPNRGRRNKLGAYHSVDLFYVFHTPEVAEGFTPADEKLSDEMMNYWVRFARTGDPNGAGAARWPAYQEKTDQHLILGVPVSVGQGLRKPTCDFLDRVR